MTLATGSTKLDGAMAEVVYNAQYAINPHYPSLLGQHDPLDVDPWERPRDPTLRALVDANAVLIAEANKLYEEVTRELNRVYDQFDDDDFARYVAVRDAIDRIAQLMGQAGATSALYEIQARVAGDSTPLEGIDLR